MIEIRIHGRGGQGAVLASLVVAHAARRRGFHVQVFPEFGVERRGAPVAAFARLDDRPIRVRTKVTRPDHVLVLDAALVRHVPVTDGLHEDGSIVVNAPDAAPLQGFGEGYRVAFVDATAIAARHKIGTSTMPIVNTTMVGAFASVTGLFGEDDLAPAIAAILSSGAERNAAAALEAFREVTLRPPFAEEALQRTFERGEGGAK